MRLRRAAPDIYVLGPVNTCFAPALLHEKRGGKARNAGHSRPMTKLCNAAPVFFRAQPKGMGWISFRPSLLAAYRGSLCRAAHAWCWTKSIAIAGAKQVLTGPKFHYRKLA